MDDLNSFGASVRARRRSLDLTQEELATRIACATITIRKIERDERRPSLQVAELLALALDIPASDRPRFLRAARGLASPDRLGRPATVGPDGRPGVPRPMTPTVGREADLDALVRLAAFSGGPARLLTITGPPGVGKTRTAQELALRARDSLGITALFVDLSVVTDAELVPAAIAARLPGPTGPGIDRVAAMVARLGRGPTVLVLDNFEQVADAAPFVVDLIQRCPELTCVVTSRGPVAVYGEHEYPLRPLGVPPVDAVLSSDAMDTWTSLTLLAHRVAAIDPRFDPATEAESMASICRAVDGLPLAIELVAAQARWRPLANVAATLADTLASLEDRRRDRPDRQASVLAAVRWSYDLLDSRVRRCFRAASVFDGPFDVAGLAAVADVADGEAVDGLRDIVGRALAHRVNGSSRYALLAVVRAVGRALLREEEESDEASRRHGALMLRRVEEATDGVELWSDPRALAAIDPIIDDLTAAMTWAFVEQGDAAIGRRIAAALGAYWVLRARVTEGARWAELTLTSAASDEDRLGPSFQLAECRFAVGDLAAAERLLRDGERMARATGDRRWLPFILGDIGMLAIIHGRLEEAEQALGEVIALAERGGGRAALELAHLYAGRLGFVRGDHDHAHRHAELALELARSLEDAWGAGTALGGHGDSYLAEDRPPPAIRSYLQALEAYLKGGFEWFAAGRLECLGNGLAAAGRPGPAAMAYGLADAWLDELGVPPHPIMHADRGRYEAMARAAGGPTFDAVLQQGRGTRRTLEVIRSLVE